MESLRLCWLGHPMVELGGQAVKLETRKAQALLSYLSLTPGECQRELLATMFWPEGSQQKALANFRRTLSSLNASLPGWIEANRETVTLIQNGNLWVDIETFHQCLSQPQQHDHTEKETCDGCITSLEKAVETCRGDFLEGLNLEDAPEFDEWQFFQRDSLRQELAVALQRLSAGYAVRGQWERAIACARRWVALDRLHEPARRVLMDLYNHADQKAAAIRQYEELAHLLREQLGQEPEQETQRLYEQVRGREGAKPDRPSSEWSTSFPLLKTKLYIPTIPASRVARSRLIERLDEAGNKALTIISAPAGFGKTTLLAEWIAQTSMPVAWLSLDNGDNDPYRFLAYLISALESIQESVGVEANQLLRSPQLVPIHIILASIINNLRKVAKPYAFILDDYQFISEHTVHETMVYLLDHIPTNMHVVIATRADPPLQLGRLRAYGQMLELRTHDLRFTPEEAAEFLNEVMRLGLSAGDIDILEARTEGWVVGLQMAAISLKGHENASKFIQDFSGSHRYVLDYLVEEVLKRQPAHIQTFLLCTSILEKLNGSLCNALMSEEWRRVGENGQTVLEYLEHSNLFLIPLDDHKQWYRYHHLFADLLRSRGGQLPREEISALHERASQWYENKGLYMEAIDHAFAADHNKAIHLVEKHSGKLIQTGHYFTVLKWIKNIPLEHIWRRPWLCIWSAWGILASGKTEGVEEYVTSAEQKLNQSSVKEPKFDPSDRQEINNELCVLRVNLAGLQDNHARTIELAQQALECIPDSAETHRINVIYTLGNAYYITAHLVEAEEAYRKVKAFSERTGFFLRNIFSTHKLATIQQMMGNLEQSFHLYEEMLNVARKTGKQDHFGMGYIYSGIGWLRHEMNHSEEAWQLIIQGARLNEMTGVPMIIADGYNLMARVLFARGELDSVETILKKTENLIQGNPALPETREMFEANRVRFWLAKGDMESAIAWGRDRQQVKSDIPSFEREIGDMALARVYIANDNLPEATRMLSELARSAQAGGRNGRLVEILLLQARVLKLQNEYQQARKFLKKSLVLGKSGNYMRIFFDEGKWLKESLKQELEQEDFNESGLSAYISKLLDAF